MIGFGSVTRGLGGNPSALLTRGLGFFGAVATASAYALSASPTTGQVGASVSVSATPDGRYTGTITVTPTGGGLSSAVVLTFSASAAPQSASFAPSAAGTVTFAGTNSGSLSNPSPATYVATTGPNLNVAVNLPAGDSRRHDPRLRRRR